MLSDLLVRLWPCLCHGEVGRQKEEVDWIHQKRCLDAFYSTTCHLHACYDASTCFNILQLSFSFDLFGDYDLGSMFTSMSNCCCAKLWHPLRCNYEYSPNHTRQQTGNHGMWHGSMRKTSLISAHAYYPATSTCFVWSAHWSVGQNFGCPVPQHFRTDSAIRQDISKAVGEEPADCKAGIGRFW